MGRPDSTHISQYVSPTCLSACSWREALATRFWRQLSFPIATAFECLPSCAPSRCFIYTSWRFPCERKHSYQSFLGEGLGNGVIPVIRELRGWRVEWRFACGQCCCKIYEETATIVSVDSGRWIQSAEWLAPFQAVWKPASRLLVGSDVLVWMAQVREKRDCPLAISVQNRSYPVSRSRRHSMLVLHASMLADKGMFYRAWEAPTTWLKCVWAWHCRASRQQPTTDRSIHLVDCSSVAVKPQSVIWHRWVGRYQTTFNTSLCGNRKGPSKK